MAQVEVQPIDQDILATAIEAGISADRPRSVSTPWGNRERSDAQRVAMLLSPYRQIFPQIAEDPQAISLARQQLLANPSLVEHKIQDPIYIGKMLVEKPLVERRVMAAKQKYEQYQAQSAKKPQ